MNKTTNAGRHATGGQLARPGVSRRGQAEPAGNKGAGITGARPQNSPRPPVLTNQATTSEGAQRMIPRPPAPFDNPNGAVNVPAPVNRNFGGAQKAGLPAKGIYGTSHGGSTVTHVGCANTETTDEAFRAVGEPRKPKGYNSIMSGHPTQGVTRKVGGGNFPKARRRG